MNSKPGSTDLLEQAMADALAAVERVEQKNKETKPGNGDDKSPDAAAAAPIDAEPQNGGAVDVVPVVVEAKPAAAEPKGVVVDEQVVPREQFLRLAADFENYRKRAIRDMDDARKYGIERLLKDLLPLLDNLDRALAHAQGDKSPVIEGVRMVAKQAAEILAGYGVIGFVSLGEPFDPERHEAVGQMPTDQHPPGTVAEEMLRGYRLHDRLLRPAQVMVAAAPIALAKPVGEPAAPARAPGEEGAGS
ncbi:MAG: nucleotide exchange factor GrpE [Deltaproteobacteria bacterium]|nr:nucleotide exchange factor GrpE [Deltaproteobacteria bacterium]